VSVIFPSPTLSLQKVVDLDQRPSPATLTIVAVRSTCNSEGCSATAINGGGERNQDLFQHGMFSRLF
jgi:hypothetical protein